MRNVYIKKTIRIRLTADDWSLYGEDDDPKRDMAAFEMNDKIEDILNNTPAKQDAWTAITKVLEEYSDFGAYDSEGYAVARDLLAEFFA